MKVIRINIQRMLVKSEEIVIYSLLEIVNLIFSNVHSLENPLATKKLALDLSLKEFFSGNPYRKMAVQKNGFIFNFNIRLQDILLRQKIRNFQHLCWWKTCCLCFLNK